MMDEVQIQAQSLLLSAKLVFFFCQCLADLARWVVGLCCVCASHPQRINTFVQSSAARSL